jgi:Ca2+-binding EF-hand superfamily protein
MDDTQLVEVVGLAKLPCPSASGSRFAAARRRRLAVEELLTRFDASETGSLSAREVRRLMVSAWGEDFMPSDEDVELVMRVGGERCKPEISAGELPMAMAIVKSMAEEQMRLSATFAKYDVNDSGQLECDQLAKLLRDLNDGEEVSSEDVAMVLRQADAGGTGTIRREELKPAIMIWYVYIASASLDKPE